MGHIILDYHLLQKNKQNKLVLFTSNGDQKNFNTPDNNLTQETIQLMIQMTLQSTLLDAISSDFSAVGLLVKGIKLSPCFLDFGTFNHISEQEHAFSKLKSYSSSDSIITTSGKNYPSKVLDKLT